MIPIGTKVRVISKHGSLEDYDGATATLLDVDSDAWGNHSHCVEMDESGTHVWVRKDELERIEEETSMNFCWNCNGPLETAAEINEEQCYPCLVINLKAQLLQQKHDKEALRKHQAQALSEITNPDLRDKKIIIIKAIRESLGCGLKEAKMLAEACFVPGMVNTLLEALLKPRPRSGISSLEGTNTLVERNQYGSILAIYAPSKDNPDNLIRTEMKIG